MQQLQVKVSNNLTIAACGGPCSAVGTPDCVHYHYLYYAQESLQDTDFPGQEPASLQLMIKPAAHIYAQEGLEAQGYITEMQGAWPGESSQAGSGAQRTHIKNAHPLAVFWVCAADPWFNMGTAVL
jgi:hypothetical protein